MFWDLRDLKANVHLIGLKALKAYFTLDLAVRDDHPHGHNDACPNKHSHRDDQTNYPRRDLTDAFVDRKGQADWPFLLAQEW